MASLGLDTRSFAVHCPHYFTSADAAADPLGYTIASQAGTSACNWTSLRIYTCTCMCMCKCVLCFVCTYECVVFVVVKSTAAFLAQLGERTTEDRKVSCSIHEEGTRFSSPTRRTDREKLSGTKPKQRSQKHTRSTILQVQTIYRSAKAKRTNSHLCGLRLDRELPLAKAFELLR